MPSVLCPCGQRVTTTPMNVGRKGVCPKCRSRVSFPPPEFASPKDFEPARRRPPFPALDGTDLEMETTQEVQPAPTPRSRETSLIPPPETERVEPWFYRAAGIAARTGLVLGVAQFPLVVGWVGAGAARASLILCSASLLLAVSLACPALLLLADIARNVRRHRREIDLTPVAQEGSTSNRGDNPPGVSLSDSSSTTSPRPPSGPGRMRRVIDRIREYAARGS